MSDELKIPDTPTALAYRHELTIEELSAQVAKVHEAMRKVMKPDVHYGIIPGTRKPTLYKPGAELLCVLFRLDPQPATEKIRDGEHLTVESTITLWHIPTGLRMGSGQGSCSTHEVKYAYRKSGRTCPECKKEDTIIKGKAEFGGGWLCFARKGGCGTKFKDGDAAIESQQTEQRVANPDLPDAWNTVTKMANKRALIAAVLNVTAASEIFTQDVAKEDEDERGDDEAPPRAEPAAQKPGNGNGNGEAVISEAQVKRFSAIATGAKWNDEQLHDLLAGHQYTSRKDIRVKDYDRLVDKIKAGPAGKAA